MVHKLETIITHIVIPGGSWWLQVYPRFTIPTVMRRVGLGHWNFNFQEGGLANTPSPVEAYGLGDARLIRVGYYSGAFPAILYKLENGRNQVYMFSR